MSVLLLLSFESKFLLRAVWDKISLFVLRSDAFYGFVLV